MKAGKGKKGGLIKGPGQTLAAAVGKGGKKLSAK